MTTLLLDGVCVAPKDVFTALQSLSQVVARLRDKNDARAVFPDVYGIITRRVAEEIQHGSRFQEPMWIARLAGLFAERYFESLVASLTQAAQPSSAWRIAYACAGNPLTLPAQDALLGINAHINFDLAQGIYDNIVGHGAQHDERLLARYRHDHDAVNEILAAALPECMLLLAERYGCPVTRLVVSLPRVQATLSRLVMAVLKYWRDRVWTDVLALLAAPQAEEREAILARMDRDSGRIALLIGLGPVLWARFSSLRSALVARIQRALPAPRPRVLPATLLARAAR
ncbi:MAG: DUF5995 family protein [Polyangia bacterium]